MKTLLKSLICVCFMSAISHAFTTTIISTTTLQSGATVYTSSITAVNFNASTSTLTNVSISSMTSTLPMSGRKITGVANGSASTDGVAFGQIHYTQTPVLATVTTSSSTALNTYIASNLTATITPTTVNSKIKITATFTAKLSAGNADAGRFTIFKGITNLGPTAGMVTLQIGSAVDQLVPCTLIYIDSPATTGSTTYTVRFSNVNGVATVGVGSDFSSDQQTMILEEVI